MEPPAVRDSNAGESIDFGKWILRLARHGRFLVVCVGLGIAAAIFYLHSAQYLYTATLQVTAVSGSGDSAGNRIAAISNLVGLNLPGSNSKTQLDLYIAALTSNDVANDLVHQPDIAQRIFAGQWDHATHSWHERRGSTSGVKDLIRQALGFPTVSWQPPDAEAMREYLARSVVISSSPLSPVVTITYEHEDPTFAKSLLLALHKAADGRLRDRSVQRTDMYIAYIADQLKHVTTTEQREALISTLSDQEKQRMAAMANISFSVDVFSSPSVSQRPTEPKPTIVLFFGALMGMFAFVLITVFQWR